MIDKIQTGTFSLQDIETQIDNDLNTMFNPKLKVSNQTKFEIKQSAMKLADNFIRITNVYKSDDLQLNYVDNVCNEIDNFVEAFTILINSINDKFVYSSVGIIWTELFTLSQKESKSNTDALFFRYGFDKLTKILMAKVGK